MAPKKAPKKEEPPPAPPPVPVDPDAEEQYIVPGANEWDAPRIYVKPREQMSWLTEKELGEEVTVALRANNPEAPVNIIHFSYTEKRFKSEPSIDQCSTIFTLEGQMMHKDSDDAKAQIDAQNMMEDAMRKDIERRKQEGQDATEDDAKGLRNQFNFSERASQTLNNGLRSRGTMTEPPPSVEYSAQSTQWEIFDGYIEDMERKKEADKKKGKKGAEAKDAKEKEDKKDADVIHSEACMHACKIIERMVNQNTYDDITQDYKFWEDASDQYREGEGTLLPLWKFFNDKAKRKHVTAVKWNPEYGDLFAVGYGSYEFMKQGTGMLCLYSLKNPSYPEFTCVTDTGVMCVDWHPQHSSVLCVGLYDGTVCVYDVRSKKQAPIFHSTVKTVRCFAPSTPPSSHARTVLAPDASPILTSLSPFSSLVSLRRASTPTPSGRSAGRRRTSPRTSTSSRSRPTAA